MNNDWDLLLQDQNKTNSEQEENSNYQKHLMYNQELLKLEQKRISQDYQHSFEGLQQAIADRNDLASNAYKLGKTAGNMEQLVQKYSGEFDSATGLEKKDFVFLFLATSLQVIRQYLLTGNVEWDKASRPNDKQAAGNHSYNRDLRGEGYYKTTVSEILSNPVPFDTQNNSASFGINMGGGKGHRYHTLGHDPIFGWIFGTANIATRTITLSNFVESYHIKYGVFGNGLRQNDYFSNRADTSKVLKYGLVEPFEHISNGILGASLFMEAKHLRSDVYSKQSLSIPFLSEINPQFAEKAGDYGIDFANFLSVSKQATYSLVINYIIAFIHRLMFNPDKDISEELYKVRTQKIISYSNIIASTSNVLFVAISSFCGVNNIKDLDIGGLIVTIGTVLRNSKVQEDIYQEFMQNKLYKEIMGY
ncbi:hypothetical protein [Companilactobacillus kimchii]|uniref:Orf30 n=2 Tax=Companilactobacillus kimchii TaxID=2801452 RepID=A0ABR5NSX9_9LACO|nr:hypothetical protein [Companilactobacillus kimchii]KAE9562129.1 hypothetical protein ATN91_05940 [Companilactobacillus kimchii]KRK51255.1 orf30 [Companilactobacillus kimchii DSM 13961 = JCM 10707]OWF34263.1 hypothetical protein LKACC12383_00176 [Companilactobacillus kimchii]GEO46179.1 hypothetical protein LKI01_01780 [Companilactobacillus paralimentarius]